jgi:hypothetical protein
MIPSDSLAALLRADVTALKHVRNAIDELLAARERSVPGSSSRSAPAIKPAKAAAAPPAMTLRTLAPLAPPRPGSLRDNVYQVLSGHPRLTRAEIVEAVTSMRPHTDRGHLISKIHDTLNHVRDPRIERVGRGVYRLVTR